MVTTDAWFAGLIDGEGCFLISVFRQHRRTLKFDPRFAISMKEGKWARIASGILKSHGIPFHIRRRRNQIEIRVNGQKAVKRLIPVVLPYLVVKKPLAQRILEFPSAPSRNRFVKANESYLNSICDSVDFVHEFNKGKNRKHKWSSDMIHEFYAKNSEGRNSRK